MLFADGNLPDALVHVDSTLLFVCGVRGEVLQAYRVGLSIRPDAVHRHPAHSVAENLHGEGTSSGKLFNLLILIPYY